MRTTLILATFVATVLAIFAAIDLHAQGRGPATSVGGNVAVIDVSYIFKNHTGLTQNKNRLKQEMEAADAALKKEGTRIQGMVEKLKGFKTGSPEYKKLEEDVANIQSGLQVHAQLQKKEFMEKQSKLYYATFQEVNDAVKYFADRNGINLVLQSNGDAVDPNNPQSVMNAITSQVVYQRGVDITPMILDDLNRNHPVNSNARDPRKSASPR